DSLSFFFLPFHPHRHLHSFPTRRSSDLAVQRPHVHHQRPGRLHRREQLQQRGRLPDPAQFVAHQHPQQGVAVVGQRRLQAVAPRSEEHTSELQSQSNLVCRLLLEKKN